MKMCKVIVLFLTYTDIDTSSSKFFDYQSKNLDTTLSNLEICKYELIHPVIKVLSNLRELKNAIIYISKEDPENSDLS